MLSINAFIYMYLPRLNGMLPLLAEEIIIVDLVKGHGF